MQGRGPEELRLSAALQAWQPDVLLLQEANGDQVGEVLPPTFQSRLWWPTAGTPPGIVIASRFALEEQALVDPLDPVWDRPRAAWARLRLGVASLTVASVHLLAPLAPGRRSRRDSQFQAVAAWAGEVGGDRRASDRRGRLQHPQPGDARHERCMRRSATGDLASAGHILVASGAAPGRHLSERWLQCPRGHRRGQLARERPSPGSSADRPRGRAQGHITYLWGSATTGWTSSGACRPGVIHCG